MSAKEESVLVMVGEGAGSWTDRGNGVGDGKQDKGTGAEMNPLRRRMEYAHRRVEICAATN